MKYDDLSFVLKDDNGEELINDIVRVVPNESNREEPYVVFTDYSLDENDEFINKYGKLVKKVDNYYIETKLTQDEIDYIEKMSEDEIIQYVNNAVEESLHE